MEQNEFQRLLLVTAICAMSCDGDIDDKEILELRKILEVSHYFRGINKIDFAEDMLGEVTTDGHRFVGNFFKQLEEAELSSTQELLILEIILRIIQADDRLDENEIMFLRLVRAKFDVYDEIIIHRFGEVPFLTKGASKQYSMDKKIGEIDTLVNKMEHAAASKIYGLFDEAKNKEYPELKSGIDIL